MLSSPSPAFSSPEWKCLMHQGELSPNQPSEQWPEAQGHFPHILSLQDPCPAVSASAGPCKPAFHPCNHRPGWAPPAGAGLHTHPRLPDQLPASAQIPSAPAPNAPPPSHRATQVLAGTFGDPRPEEDSRAQRGRALALGSTGESAHPSEGQGTGQAPARTGSCGSATRGAEGPELSPVPAHSLQASPERLWALTGLSRTTSYDPRNRATLQTQRLCPLCGDISGRVLLPQAPGAFGATGNHFLCQNLPRGSGALAPNTWGCLQTCGDCLRVTEDVPPRVTL